MQARYLYIDWVVDQAQVLAGAVAVVLFLSGLSDCRSGLGGLIHLGVSAIVAALGFVAVMVVTEVLRLLRSIEDNTRPPEAAGGPTAAG